MGADTLLPSGGGVETGSIRESRPLTRERARDRGKLEDRVGEGERDRGMLEDRVGEGEKVDVGDEGAGGGVVANGGDGEEKWSQRTRSTEEASGPTTVVETEEGVWRACMGRRR
jgi:hypothetical protein